MANDGETLLILGGSTRAAAFSARRAGLRVSCGDLYGDADLRTMCPVTVVKDYPQGLATVARESPAGSWMFTGALENHPRLVEQIETMRPLVGNGGDVLRRVRNPWVLAEAIKSAGLSVPGCIASQEGLPRDGTWLKKKRRSAGGLQVEVWGEESDVAEPSRNDEAGWYFQQRIEGLCCSAVYVANGERAVLLGATEQLVGAQCGQCREHIPSAFCYAGSIGPLETSADERDLLGRIGDVLTAEFKLRGLFGVDLIYREGDFFPIEVNPRYTASMEIVERQLDNSLVRWHVDACREGRLPVESQTSAARELHGKAIVYAARTSKVLPDMTARLMTENEGNGWPVVADIPVAGTLLESSQPAATVFAEGDSREEVVERLRERVEWCREVLEV